MNLREKAVVVGVAVVLLVAGAMVVGGVYLVQTSHESMTTCGTPMVYDYSVVNESNVSADEVVHYDNLTAEEQRAFRRLVQSGEGSRWSDRRVPVVAYQGAYYELKSGFPPCNGLVDMIMFVGGLVFTLFGLLTWLVVVRQAREGWRTA